MDHTPIPGCGLSGGTPAPEPTRDPQKMGKKKEQGQISGEIPRGGVLLAGPGVTATRCLARRPQTGAELQHLDALWWEQLLPAAEQSR